MSSSITFSDDFWWSPNVATTIHYRAGQTYQVPRACADAAIKAGRAKPAPRPEKTPIPSTTAVKE